MGAQFGAAFFVVLIGIAFGMIGLRSYLIGDEINQYTGGSFLMIGFFVFVVGLLLFGYVYKRQDW